MNSKVQPENSDSIVHHYRRPQHGPGRISRSGSTLPVDTLTGTSLSPPNTLLFARPHRELSKQVPELRTRLLAYTCPGRQLAPFVVLSGQEIYHT
jgi:hypothetical protein